MRDDVPSRLDDLHVRPRRSQVDDVTLRRPGVEDRAAGRAHRLGHVLIASKGVYMLDIAASPGIVGLDDERTVQRHARGPLDADHAGPRAARGPGLLGPRELAERSGDPLVRGEPPQPVILVTREVAHHAGLVDVFETPLTCESR